MFENLNEMIYHHADVIGKIFKKHKIDAPVTERNVANAIVALPEVKKDIATAFEGYDNATGKRKLNADSVANALGIAAAAAGTIAAIKNKKGQEQAEPEPEPEKPKAKTVFGLNVYLFWSIVVIVILIIILWAVKSLRK